MSNTNLAKRLTDTLPSSSQKLFNPWRDRCADCKPCNGPDEKLARLAAHLACVPKFILCGEAPSHRGCRHSGIAFTSECQLLDGEIPGISIPTSDRLTSRPLPYSERSATIVWGVLKELRVEKRTILWNALPMHPHEQGKQQSNRTPKSSEIQIGERALRMLVDEFPKAKVVAVGRKAEGLLKRMDARDVRYVRHPAHGGAKDFAQQMEGLASEWLAHATRG